MFKYCEACYHRPAVIHLSDVADAALPKVLRGGFHSFCSDRCMGRILRTLPTFATSQPIPGGPS